ncbi:hypothetical protein ACFPT7_10880 [Acidicapsa dinghuensis]|uniref:Uncharacterized protein n=1 Tax=Acidicapsa dinghuensis TaxID=2218256 RepID=A0ABW1EES7_9BACT|nr:hypothetical protein [Acidicapsa dinghuensis]
MANGGRKLDLILNDIETNCEPSRYAAACLPFMVECASLIESELPRIAFESLQTAKSYLRQEAGTVSVQQALSECWRELDKKKRTTSFDDPEVCAIRAVICILHDQVHSEPDDLVDRMSNFLEILNGVVPREAEQESLLRLYFSGCI